MSFDHANFALKSVCPNNRIIFDDKGMPSVFVYVPKFRLCDVLSIADTNTHPAFIVNGTEIDGFWCGKFQTHHYAGRAYSLPAEDPSVNDNIDTFVAYNRAKGGNFHEITNAEWAAIALWCHKHGCEPRGNNNFGKDMNETGIKAIPSTERDAYNRVQRVATGTGPIEWSHDRSLSGIWDLKGNVSEWCTGLRLVNSEIQVIPDNNAAQSNVDLSSSSTAWKAINAAATGWDDLYLTPNGNGTTANSVKLHRTNTFKWKYKKETPTGTYNEGCYFYEVTADDAISATAQKLLMALALLPDTDLTGTGIDEYYGYNHISVNTGNAESRICRGTNFYNYRDQLEQNLNPGIFDITTKEIGGTNNQYIGGRSAYFDPQS